MKAPIELYLLKILVEMQKDTGKSDEEIIEELLSVKLEDSGVDFEKIETVHGTITLIKHDSRKDNGRRKYDKSGVLTPFFIKRPIFSRRK